MRKVRCKFAVLAAAAVLALSVFAPVQAQVAGITGANDLVVAQNGATTATIVAVPEAVDPEDRRPSERLAVNDLQKFIGLMTGAKPALVNAIPPGNAPVFIVGRAALAADPTLQAALDKVKKKNPTIRADAIVVRRAGNRVYLAGTNDESHYFAVAWLLKEWGCRFYIPTEVGEVIPEYPVLKVGAVDMAYAPPFELRHYWIAWTGSNEGAVEFRRRNFMTETSMVGMGHALETYIKEIVPAGKSGFNIPFSDPKTAEHIASKIEADYAAGKSISLAIEDGNYTNDSASDKALIFEYDRYMLKPSLSDAMLTLYNNVGKILRQKHPNSKAKIGGMAYANVTLPPKKVLKVEPNVVMWIAPIDVDPIHGMDDPKSPPRQEYRDWMYAWAKVTDGRLAIYDYDQGMLVWRDMPNPSHTAFAQDVKHYQKAGILGVGTESRNAIGTVFTNLYFRGQLMWNPNADVKAMLAEFYTKFYGPAAAPMATYWNTIYDSWDNSIVTEHEYMVAPAIYTPEVVGKMRTALAEAQKIFAPLRAKANLTRNEKLYLDRMAFTQGSFDIINNYMGATWASAHDVNYKQAAAFADAGLAARNALGALNSTYISVVNEGGGPAWWKGEGDFMREIGSYVDGPKGTLIAKTPLEWMFKRAEPLPKDWQYKGPEGPAGAKDLTLATQPATVANDWEKLRTDMYLQAQGVLNPDKQSYTGHYWYQTTLNLTADQTTGKVNLMFPGLFNETWLYVNGELVGHRAGYNEPWWLTDYKFMWDVNLTGKLKPGNNVIALRGFNPHHFGGIFRRPFLYRAAG